MKQSIFNKASTSYKFYQRLFRTLSLNDILYQTGRAKLIKDMTPLEYKDYLEMIAMDVKDVGKAS